MNGRKLPFSVWMLIVVSHAHSSLAEKSASELFRHHCVDCHRSHPSDSSANQWFATIGKDHSGLDARWTSIIEKGLSDNEMPAFAERLSPQQIRALVVWMREQSYARYFRLNPARYRSQDGVFVSERHRFSLEPVVTVPGLLWSMSAFGDDQVLLTEKSGTLYRYSFAKDKLTVIENTPEVWLRGQGGLLDVLVNPQYPKQKWVYLAYSEEVMGMTAIARGQIVNDKWRKHQDVFLHRDNKRRRYTRAIHFGTRMVIDDGYLYFAIGDRGLRNGAQDLSTPNGKIHRLHLDGRIPPDNPFVESGYPSIWTYGHRNPQGLCMRFTEKGAQLWSVEHGPRGGDELNRIHKGLNYGWPLVGLGIHYDGQPWQGVDHDPKMTDPEWSWTPSLAVSNIGAYYGKEFPRWSGDLFVASLKEQELHRLSVVENEVVQDEILLRAYGRIRDVRYFPNMGLLLLIERGGHSDLIRIKPVPQ